MLLNQLIFWNDSIVFPESLRELEEKLRGWENSSRHFTDAILSTTTIPGLVSGIAIVGCLTGFAEELFFRAGIQRQLCKAIPGHAAVWISAFIFSAMHFQFFGFFPRLLFRCDIRLFLSVERLNMDVGHRSCLKQQYGSHNGMVNGKGLCVCRHRKFRSVRKWFSLVCHVKRHPLDSCFIFMAKKIIKK